MGLMGVTFLGYTQIHSRRLVHCPYHLFSPLNHSTTIQWGLFCSHVEVHSNLTPWSWPPLENLWPLQYFKCLLSVLLLIFVSMLTIHLIMWVLALSKQNIHSFACFLWLVCLSVLYVCSAGESNAFCNFYVEGGNCSNLMWMHVILA